ncbi:hypothetical protein GCM10011392_34920 [Wenxinia marina]|nr:hypothetical protein GCM10011392_34920 [Wenxinia marina]
MLRPVRFALPIAERPEGEFLHDPRGRAGQCPAQAETALTGGLRVYGGVAVLCHWSALRASETSL